MLDFTAALPRIPWHKSATLEAGVLTEIRVDARVGRLSMVVLDQDAKVSMDPELVDGGPLGDADYLTLWANTTREYLIREDLTTGVSATRSYFVVADANSRLEVTVEVG